VSSRFCRNGHDRQKFGRYASSGACRECDRLYNVAKRGRAAGGTGRGSRHLVAVRSLRRLAGSKEAAAAAWRGYKGYSQQRATNDANYVWNREWISILTADEWCLALGSNLSIVYPELYIGESA
jgi:hypothetical protein